MAGGAAQPETRYARLGGDRVMATAGPGEIVVSRTVRDLVAGSDTVLQDRGAHHLKGVEGAWQLFAVGG